MIGQNLGPYRLLEKLGEGGMGEVYRARDAQLNRDVAIKVLLPSVAGDPDRLARFSREAQVLASLNHPNIAAIYGLEPGPLDGPAHAGHHIAIVMELVEGEDLAGRIARGPIPLDDALPIARQIAEALEAAHEQGIIHRDLKPANIKVRADGTVKVLDFGLAKAMDPAGASSANAMNSPTLSMHATQAGMILGTAAYMSPEQAKGKPVDKRADVWAFGVVLYEMLTGAKAFPGEDISDTLATLLKFDPDWSRLPADTPLSIRRLLKRCLTKDPKLRLRECGSAIVDIHEALSASDPSMAVAPAVDHQSRLDRRRSVMPAIAAISLVALAVVTAWAVWGNRALDTPQPTRRFTITLPQSFVLPPSTGTLLALSPDGRTLVYRASAPAGTSQLFRRPIDQFEGSVMAGTENGREPFFSPDGQWLGFQVEQTLKKTALSGGLPQTLATKIANSRGGSWGPDGVIVISNDLAGGSLFKIPAAGGEATALSNVEGANRPWYPQILPGGKVVLFTIFHGTPDSGNLHVLKLESGEQRTVLSNAVAGRVLPSGHLVFVRGGALWAVPFDLDRLETAGTPVLIVEGVRVENGGAVQYAVSDEGTLAYIPGSAQLSGNKTLAFVNREGRSEVLTAPPRDYQDVALSPDQTRVAVQIGVGINADVWVAEAARGTLTRVTNEPGFDGYPLWSKDGTAVMFASSRDGRWTIQRKAADGTGAASLLGTFDKARGVRPYSWSPDGGTLVVDVDGAIATVGADGKGQPKLLIQSAVQPAVSPDGRWLAYASDESGEAQVYLQRFPNLGDRRVVSAAGIGYLPTWSRDGGALFYLRGGPPNAVMRVSIRNTPDGHADIGIPAVLAGFQYYSRMASYRSYDVSRDGQRLLVISRDGEADSALRQINVVVNWTEELKRLVPLR